MKTIVHLGLVLQLLAAIFISSTTCQHLPRHQLKHKNFRKNTLLRANIQRRRKYVIASTLKELDLIELASVPGITNPLLLETSLSPSACQFGLLEDLRHDINLNCGDYRLNKKKFNMCRGPKLDDQAASISSKCCRTCTQCSGCEGLDVPDAEAYEKDSPGNWYSKRVDVEDKDFKQGGEGEVKT